MVSIGYVGLPIPMLSWGIVTQSDREESAKAVPPPFQRETSSVWSAF